MVRLRYLRSGGRLVKYKGIAVSLAPLGLLMLTTSQAIACPPAPTGAAGEAYLGCTTNDTMEVEAGTAVTNVQGAGGSDTIVVRGDVTGQVNGAGNGQDNSAAADTSNTITIYGSAGSVVAGTAAGNILDIDGGTVTGSVNMGVGGIFSMENSGSVGDRVTIGDGGRAAVSNSSGLGFTFGSGSETLTVENVNLSGTSFMGEGDDAYIQSGSGRVSRVNMGGGNDRATLNDGNIVILDLGAGDDRVDMAAGSANYIYTGAGNDEIYITGGTVSTAVRMEGGNTLIDISGGFLGGMQGNTDNFEYRVSGDAQISRMTGNMGSGGVGKISITGGVIGSAGAFGNGKIDARMSGGTVNREFGFSGYNDTFYLSGGQVGIAHLEDGDDYLSISGGSTIGLVTLDRIMGGVNTVLITDGRVDTLQSGVYKKGEGSLYRATDNSIYVRDGASVGLMDFDFIFASEVENPDDLGTNNVIVEGGNIGEIIGGEGSENILLSGGDVGAVATGLGNDVLRHTGGTLASFDAGGGDDSAFIMALPTIDFHGGAGYDRIDISSGGGIYGTNMTGWEEATFGAGTYTLGENADLWAINVKSDAVINVTSSVNPYRIANAGVVDFSSLGVGSFNATSLTTDPGALLRMGSAVDGNGQLSIADITFTAFHRGNTTISYGDISAALQQNDRTLLAVTMGLPSLADSTFSLADAPEGYALVTDTSTAKTYLLAPKNVEDPVDPTDPIDPPEEGKILTSGASRVHSVLAFNQENPRMVERLGNRAGEIGYGWFVANGNRMSEIRETIKGDFSTYSLTGGYQIAEAGVWKFGLLGGMRFADYSLVNIGDHDEKMRSNEIFIGASATALWNDGTYVDGILTIGRADLRLNTGRDHVRSKHEVNTVSLTGEVGRKFKTDWGNITPYAQMNLARIGSFGVDINGDADLRIKNRATTFTTVKVGVDADKTLENGVKLFGGIALVGRTDNGHTQWEDVNISTRQNESWAQVDFGVSNAVGSGEMYGNFSLTKGLKSGYEHGVKVNVGYRGRF